MSLQHAELIFYCLDWGQVTSLSWVDGATQEETEAVQECAWTPFMGLEAIGADGMLTLAEIKCSMAFSWPVKIYLQGANTRAVKE